MEKHVKCRVKHFSNRPSFLHTAYNEKEQYDLKTSIGKYFAG